MRILVLLFIIFVCSVSFASNRIILGIGTTEIHSQFFEMPEANYRCFVSIRGDSSSIFCIKVKKGGKNEIRK